MKSLVVTLLLTILVSGCVPVKVRSEKAPDFSETIQSIAVWHHQSKVESKVLFLKGKMKKIVGLVAEELSNQGINNEVVTTDSVTLNKRQKIDAAADSLDTPYLLYVLVTKSYSRGAATVFNISASVYDRRSKKEVWKSSTDFTFENQSNADAAEKIVQKMAEDGLFANKAS